MICKSITYYNYRNIERERLELSPGVNVIWGDNAQGKSNMLEGVYFFARGRSFRGAKEKELVRFGEKEAQLSLSYLRQGSTAETELSALLPQNGKKSVYRNGARLTSLREMIGSFRAVLFCPAHLSLVSGGPSMRRSFLDIALSQLSPSYLKNLSDYNRALLQRGALIKAMQRGETDSGLLPVYAQQLASSGARLAAGRAEYVRELARVASELFGQMTDGRETPEFLYRSDAAEEGMTGEEILRQGEARLYELFTSAVEKEIKYGATLYGVHRDDIAIRLNGRDARLYASQGQQRSLALVMKLAEGETARRESGEYPVFLLDDVLSELDSQRKAFILSCLEGRQIIVTSCETESFSDSGVNLIEVKNGKITGGITAENGNG